MSSWILPAFLGLGLAAACGIRAFLPLLLLSGAVHFHVVDVGLNSGYAWIGSTTALVTLAIAAAVELTADAIPYVDHLVSAIGNVTGPIAGAIAAGSVFASHDPTVAAIAGIIIGAPTALTFSATQTGVRAASTLTTAGIANPFISIAEDILTVIMSAVAMVLPILIPIVLAVLIYLAWRVVRKFRSTRPGTQSPR